jgi:hypothetical protein
MKINISHINFFFLVNFCGNDQQVLVRLRKKKIYDFFHLFCGFVFGVIDKSSDFKSAFFLEYKHNCIVKKSKKVGVPVELLEAIHSKSIF